MLSLYDNFLSVGLAKENRFCKFDFVLPEFVEFSHKNLLFIKTKVGHFNYFFSKMPYLFLFKFDYDKINGLIHLRNRMSGDKIKLPRRTTKKIKSLMQETRSEEGAGSGIHDTPTVFPTGGKRQFISFLAIQFSFRHYV